MIVLFDQNMPRKLRRYLKGHVVTTAYEMGWDRTVNGALVNAAEFAGFDVFVTCDQNLTYQQNIVERKIANVELTKGSWPAVKIHAEEIAAAVNSCVAGSHIRVICGR